MGPVRKVENIEQGATKTTEICSSNRIPAEVFKGIHHNTAEMCFKQDDVCLVLAVNSMKKSNYTYISTLVAHFIHIHCTMANKSAKLHS